MSVPVRRLVHLVPLAVFAAFVLWMAVPLLRGADPREIPSALIDRPAPTFDLPPLPGRSAGFSRADLGGQVALVNVFASWCVPCLAEQPVLMRLAGEQGVPIYGINYKDKAEDATAWLTRNGNPYQRIGADPDGRAAIDWGVYGVPETFVVDRQGRIQLRHAGPLTPDVVGQEILPLIERLRG